MSAPKHIIVPLFIAAVLVPTGGIALAHQSQARPNTSARTAAKLVKVGHSATLGNILVGGPKGLTLYHRLTEDTGAITCTGKCLTFWPPLLLPRGVKKPTGGKAVVDKLGVIRRPDISKTAMQVTYDGWPLYYWQGDTKPGQTTGQGIGHFAVLPPAPMVTFTINITNTGTTWGTVGITGTYHGKKFSRTCSDQTCTFRFHAGVSLNLTQTPLSKATWPFEQWEINSADGGIKKTSTASSIKVTSNDNYSISADYVVA